MSTKFPAGIDLLLAGFVRGTRESLGRNCDRHIEHLRAISSGCENTPSYTGAVKVEFSDSDTITLTTEEVKPLLKGLEGTDDPTLATHGLQDLFRFKECPIEVRLLETALLWLRADVWGDLPAAEGLIAKENVAMYGTVGREEALRFKRQWLPQVRKLTTICRIFLTSVVTHIMIFLGKLVLSIFFSTPPRSI